MKRSGKEYFDLSVSYSDYIAQIDGQDDYLKSAAEFGSGIRILRQDTWEMIITFILSQQNKYSPHQRPDPNPQRKVRKET